jgi:hypothetical protein
LWYLAVNEAVRNTPEVDALCRGTRMAPTARSARVLVDSRLDMTSSGPHAPHHLHLTGESQMTTAIHKLLTVLPLLLLAGPAMADQCLSAIQMRGELRKLEESAKPVYGWGELPKPDTPHQKDLRVQIENLTRAIRGAEESCAQLTRQRNQRLR